MEYLLAGRSQRRDRRRNCSENRGRHSRVWRGRDGGGSGGLDKDLRVAQREQAARENGRSVVEEVGRYLAACSDSQACTKPPLGRIYQVTRMAGLEKNCEFILGLI